MVMTNATAFQELQIKHDKIKKLLDEKNLDGIIFTTHSSFKWLSCGRANDVLKNDNASLVYFFITPDKKYFIASRSDSSRVMDEELGGLGYEAVLYNWYNESVFDAVKRLGNYIKIGSDFVSDSTDYISNEIASVRAELTEFEIDRYKKTCAEYTALLTDYCMKIKPGMTEIEIANGLLYAGSTRHIRFPALMVGSDERISLYRHPAATNKKVKNYVLFATVMEREGICANVSRSVYFGPAPEELKMKQDAVNTIEATYQSYSTPGITLGELFEKGKKAYEDAGYAGEWENHLQGGISGYSPLEFLAFENSRVKVKENNIMAWNPTIKGAKSEDPAHIAKNEPLQYTIDPRWPSKEYTIRQKKFVRPLILEI
jgi:Xaa-Pro dipeptidase